MNVLNLLTQHPVVEINLSTGLRTGHMLAQHKFVKPANAADYVENGVFFRIDKTNDDRVVLADNANAMGPYWLHFTEELITHGLSSAYKYFAVDYEKDGNLDVCYPRCIALYAGDAFSTDNFIALGEGETLANMKYAVVGTGGRLKLSQNYPTVAQGNTYEGPIFRVKQVTMPNGNAGVQCVVMDAMGKITA